MPSAVLNSPGSASGVADARQWKHANWHALVTSQNTSIGRWA
jgi:hypothetical protein